MQSLPKPPRHSLSTETPPNAAEEQERTGARPCGALRVGRYEVNSRIAAGGMATVHIGRLLGAVGFARIVAIKRLLPQFAADREFETMFVEEARLAARIQHPNVVSTLDVVASDGELLLVMEYVTGESLASLMPHARAAKPVPQPIAVGVICDALHGLHAAHEAKDRNGQPLGIVHRDVSPQNIMVGVDGVARVLDFGIAKAADSVHTTREGTVRGKLAYMAPEQLFGHALTRQIDLYAVGVVLWELLVGERLFPGSTRPELLRKVEGQLPRPSDRAPTYVPPALDGIVMRALATAAEDRFASAREMASQLESTCELATRSAIAEWVESIASASLAARAAVVASMESSAYSSPPSLSARPVMIPSTQEPSASPPPAPPLGGGPPRVLPLGGSPPRALPLGMAPPPVPPPGSGSTRVLVPGSGSPRILPPPPVPPLAAPRSPTASGSTRRPVLLAVGAGAALLLAGAAAGALLFDHSAPAIAPAQSAKIASAVAPTQSAKMQASTNPTERLNTAAGASASANAKKTPKQLVDPAGDRAETAELNGGAPEAKGAANSGLTPAPADSLGAKPIKTTATAPPRRSDKQSRAKRVSNAKAAHCSPPYSVDSHGRRHYKSECF